MRIYKVYDPDNAERPAKFRKTQSDAGADIKAVSDPDFRMNIQVDLCEVKPDQPNFVKALNGDHASIEMNVIKSWRGTKRGGMRDLDDGCETLPPDPPQKTQDAAAFWESLNAKK